MEPGDAQNILSVVYASVYYTANFDERSSQGSTICNWIRLLSIRAIPLEKHGRNSKFKSRPEGRPVIEPFFQRRRMSELSLNRGNGPNKGSGIDLGVSVTNFPVTGANRPSQVGENFTHGPRTAHRRVHRNSPERFCLTYIPSLDYIASSWLPHNRYVG